jgi:Bacterial archaeo-eukaryotic release factor family 2
MSRHPDLQAVTDTADWFVTITMPTPSNLPDARSRFELEWRHARAQLSDAWPADELAGLDERVSEWWHGDSAGLVVVHGLGGSTLVEAIDEPVEATVHEGPLPRCATVIEARQRTIPHVVVETDRSGADLTAFDGGSVLATETVDGETLHIHRGHPGGWSQRRFQQRAENTWEDNARQVAAAVADLAHQVGARHPTPPRDVRAQGFVLEHLPNDVADIAVKIDAGSPDGIADEIVRLLSTITAEEVTAATERMRAGVEHDLASVDTDRVLAVLDEGRVDTLLAHDDGAPSDDGSARAVDRAIAAALATDAEVVVVPKLAMLRGPVAATLRW